MFHTDPSSLLIEWRIQKRVEEQFSAFMSGFNELIPPELISVFDERELELLIGGITDIDVDDWKKHTDYRGYTESDEVIRNFWTVRLCLQRHHRHIADGGHSAFEVGTRSRSPDCYNSQRARLVSLSTASRIFRAVMALGDSPSRKLERSRNSLNHILGKSEPLCGQNQG